jgi:hypothetical protein
MTQYGITIEDVFNFDETGFAMGLISGSGARKAVGSLNNVGRITVIEPGNRKWVTTIECVNATGWIIPPFIIFDGKVHLRYWYDQPLPKDIRTGLSDNG